MIAGKIWIDVFYKRFYIKSHTETEFYGHAKMMRFIWWVAYTILAFGLFFRNVGALLTSLGLIGFGITFALQKPILNFVGWMTIVTTRPYGMGDRIKVGNINGDVIDIHVMNTVLISILENSDVRSDKVVTVPNELVLTTAVENYTKSSNFIVSELTINIKQNSNYRAAMELLQRIVEEETQQNIHLFRQRLSTRRIEIEKRINRLTRRFLQAPEDDRDVRSDIKLLERERKGLDLLLGEVREQFQPKVRIELKDNAISLVCQFYCPYNAVKKTRTEINLKFLDSISKSKDIRLITTSTSSTSESTPTI
jgi:small-conductance mechanosensitive channel